MSLVFPLAVTIHLPLFYYFPFSFIISHFSLIYQHIFFCLPSFHFCPLTQSLYKFESKLLYFILLSLASPLKHTHLDISCGCFFIRVILHLIQFLRKQPFILRFSYVRIVFPFTFIIFFFLSLSFSGVYLLPTPERFFFYFLIYTILYSSFFLLVMGTSNYQSDNVFVQPCVKMSFRQR